MTIAVIALAVALVGALYYIRCVDNAVDAILDQLAATADNEQGFRRELKKEMTKLHSLADEAAKRCNDLSKKQKEFEDLADESVRAQIDAEKAWAEGVRAIASYGVDIPTLNTKGLNHE